MRGQWIKFENTGQLNQFTAAVEVCYESVTEMLLPDELPLFYDFWLRVLNSHDFFILVEGEKVWALAARPRVSDLHYHRWNDVYLGFSPQTDFAIELPCEFDNDEFFLLPLLSENDNRRLDGRLFGRQIERYQYNLYCRLRRNFFDGAPPNIKFRFLQRPDITPIQEMITFENLGKGTPEVYYPLIKQEIYNSYYRHSSWTYSVVDEPSGRIIGFAMYLGLPLPLTGLEGAIVGEILVLPEWRRRGIARALQKFAYSDLARRKLKFVCGNIRCFNTASLAQARGVGRENWTCVIRAKRPGRELRGFDSDEAAITGAD